MENNDSTLTINGGRQLALPMEIPAGTKFDERHFTLPPGTTLDQCKNAMRFVARCRESSGFWLTEVTTFVRKSFGDEAAKEMCRECAVPMQLFKESQLLSRLPEWDYDLGAEYHFVIARANFNSERPTTEHWRKMSDTEKAQWEINTRENWFEIAKREKLTAAELAKSIDVGSVQRITPDTGDGSAGVTTWGGIRMQFDIIRRRIGDEWKNWGHSEIDTVLGQLMPLLGFAADLQWRKRDLAKNPPVAAAAAVIDVESSKAA